MSFSHASLDSAAVDRKTRLAKLASLKRKQNESDTNLSVTEGPAAEAQQASDTEVFLSGRNYDLHSRGPKLGFENAPSSNVITLEQQADLVAGVTAEQAVKDEAAAEEGIDLFKLQPKKPNWDLKRDLDEKMKILDIRTQNAIARLVRERIDNTKREAKAKAEANTASIEASDQEVGIEGVALVQGVHAREREEQEDERRERVLDEADDNA